MRYNTYHSPAKLLFDMINTSSPRQTIVQKKPLTNLIEHDDKYNLELAAPGLSKKDFTLSAEEYFLTIAVNLEDLSEVKKPSNREFDYSSFSKKIKLPKHIDREGIKATYKHGILNITLPKKAKAEVELSKVIEIN